MGRQRGKRPPAVFDYPQALVAEIAGGCRHGQRRGEVLRQHARQVVVADAGARHVLADEVVADDEDTAG